MPQNFPGVLVRCFLSKLLIWSMSSLVSSKSKTWKFSSNLLRFDVFGMTTVLRWMPHRRTIWATVLLYFAASPWHERNKIMKLLLNQNLSRIFLYSVVMKIGDNLLIKNGRINLLWELDHPNMTLNRTIQCWLQHLLEECEL